MHIETIYGMKVNVPDFVDIHGLPFKHPTTHSIWHPAKNPHNNSSKDCKPRFAAIWWFDDDQHYHAWDADRLNKGNGDWEIRRELVELDADAIMGSSSYGCLYFKGHPEYIVDPKERKAKILEFKQDGIRLEDPLDDEPFIICSDWWDCHW